MITAGGGVFGDFGVVFVGLFAVVVVPRMVVVGPTPPDAVAKWCWSLPMVRKLGGAQGTCPVGQGGAPLFVATFCDFS